MDMTGCGVKLKHRALLVKSCFLKIYIEEMPQAKLSLSFFFSILQKTVDCMTTMSVPSTLVKCLYLFFDLPHMPEVPGATQTELPLADRRALLQKVFVQVSSCWNLVYGW